MDVRSFTDPDEFWAVAEPVVLAEPVLHSVIASVVDAVRSQPGLYAGHDFYVVERPGKPAFLAHHTPPFPLHVPVADAEAAASLADVVNARGGAPSGVSGDVDSATAFAQRWCELTRARQRVSARLGRYDLPVSPRVPWTVPGRHRMAGPDDVPLVDRWLAEFAAEIGVPVPGVSQRHVDDGRVWLWCDPEPVAMALTSVPVGGVTRISYVYTPPGHRGHGYASAVTAAASAARQALGLRCTLFTDVANPTSNGIYAALGYRLLGEAVEIEFLP